MLSPNGIMSDTKIILASALFFVLVGVLTLRRKQSPNPLPPGPKGRLLVGSLWQLSHQLEQDFIAWGEEYSMCLGSSFYLPLARVEPIKNSVKPKR